MIDEGLMNPF